MAFFGIDEFTDILLNPIIEEAQEVAGDTVGFVQDPSFEGFVDIADTPLTFGIDVGVNAVDDQLNENLGMGLPNEILGGSGDRPQQPPTSFGPAIGPDATIFPPTQQPPPASGPNDIPNETGMYGIDMPDPLPPNGTCPVGYMPNPNPAPSARSFPTANARAAAPNCVPMDTTPAATPANEPPAGCIPGVADTNSWFKEQSKACTTEWKTLEKLETEIKARYEQLCMAREKFNQRQERYGGMCGPYELLYGITENKEKEAKAKEKAKHEHGTSSGGCGCAHKPPEGGCGCGCSGKTSTSTSTPMEFKYEDPVKSACKRAVDDSFKPPAAKKTRVTPARAAKSSCMPCKLKQPKVYRTTILRRPANTVPPTPKAKSKKTTRAKTVRKVAPKAKRQCR